jgi:hypothetical protein
MQYLVYAEPALHPAGYFIARMNCFAIYGQNIAIYGILITIWTLSRAEALRNGRPNTSLSAPEGEEKGRADGKAEPIGSFFRCLESKKRWRVA